MQSFTFASLAILSLLSFAYAGCARNYTVVAGDVCDGISTSQSVSTYQLAASNTAINSGCTNLQVGDNLCLGWSDYDCTTTHTVKVNDTCLGLLNTYTVNQTVFATNNPQIDATCSNLYVGEVMCMAKSVIVLPYGSNPVNVDWDDPNLPYC